jgi:hypothetical protein
MALPGNEKNKLKQRSTVNNLNTEDNLKILLRIPSIIKLTITSFIHLLDWATYIWSTLDTVRICSATSFHIFQTTTFSVGRSTFNPHLPSGFSFLQTQEYRLPGVEVFDHRQTTIRGVGRRVVARWGSLIFLSEGDRLWRRFNLGSSCETVQEIES